MKQLPESLLFRSHFFFLIGVTFMTPLCAIALDVLLLHYVFQGFYSIITLIVSLIFFINGFKLIRQTHFYMQRQERLYGLIT
jgi:hypothetical protein